MSRTEICKLSEDARALEAGLTRLLLQSGHNVLGC